MTDFVRLVRSADAVLLAATHLDDAARTAGRRFVPRSMEPRITAQLETAARSMDDAVEHAPPWAADATTAVGQARAAVQALRDARPRHSELAAAVPPIRQQVDDAHRALIRMLDRTSPPADPNVASRWERAAALVRGGTELPDSFRRSGEALRNARTPVAGADGIRRALDPGLEQMRSRDLAQLAGIIQQLDVLERAAHGLDGVSVRELDRAARLVEQGIELPLGWRARPALDGARARSKWPTIDAATDRLRELLWSPSGPRAKEEWADLRALRQLPDDLRPAPVDRVPADGRLDAMRLRELRQATADATTRSMVLEDLRSATSSLETVLEAPRANILKELEGIKEGLLRYAHLPLPEQEQQVLRSTLDLLELNIKRQHGKVRGGYGSWTDLAEVGRVRQGAKLLDRLETARAQPVDDAVDATRAVTEPVDEAGGLVW
jgi:hypothetical protein